MTGLLTPKSWCYSVGDLFWVSVGSQAPQAILMYNQGWDIISFIGEQWNGLSLGQSGVMVPWWPGVIRAHVRWATEALAAMWKRSLLWVSGSYRLIFLCLCFGAHKGHLSFDNSIPVMATKKQSDSQKLGLGLNKVDRLALWPWGNSFTCLELKFSHW